MVDQALRAPADHEPVATATESRARVGVSCSTLLIALLIGVRVAAVVLALTTPGGAVRTSAYGVDARRYHQIAEHAGTPYRDFQVEFPPVTLGFIELVNGSSHGTTTDRLGIASLALDLVVVGLLAWGWGRRVVLAYLVLGLPFLLLPFVYFRADLLSVALALGGLALVRRDRERAGGVLLALAVFAKLWPLALLPVLVYQRRWRALAASVVTGAIGGVAWIAWTGTSGIMQVLTFRHAHGWQIESMVGGILRLFVNDPTRVESGAVRVGTAPWWASPLLGIVLVASVAWLWRRAERCRRLGHEVGDGVVALTAVGIFVLCSPLFSPQYLVWFVPFAAICWATGSRSFPALVGIVIVLTMLLVAGYSDLTDGRLAAELLLVARNFAVLAVVAAGFVATRLVPQSSPDDSVPA